MYPTTARQIAFASGIVALLVALLAIEGNPPRDLVFAALIPAPIIAGGVALSAWLDRSTVRELSRRASGPYAAGFERASARGRYDSQMTGVTTVCVARSDGLRLYDVRQDRILRTMRRLRLLRRPHTGGPAFDAVVYADNRRIATKLFQSAESRAAVLALFERGFFMIRYRRGLVTAIRRGDVSDDLYAAVQPLLGSLAGAKAASAKA